MKIEIALPKENILAVMRRCGYSPEDADEKTGELRWTRPLMGGRYPRFHIYSKVSPDNTTATLELHLDQKQPSYQGTAAHSGEYDGPVVEAESKRIKNTMEQETSPIQPFTRKERRALKRTEKQEKRSQEKDKKGLKKIVLLTLGVLAIAGAVGAFFVFAPEGKAPEPDYSKAIPDEGRTHVNEGTNVQHQSNPPTSGDHWPVPLADGIYDKEKPDEAVVHSLEHGRVWISYKPSIPEQTKKALEELLKKYNGTVLTPRSANDTDIALAAWNRLDTFNLNPDGTFDEQRITDFINRWQNKGPEFVPGSGGGKEYEE